MNIVICSEKKERGLTILNITTTCAHPIFNTDQQNYDEHTGQTRKNIIPKLCIRN